MPDDYPCTGCSIDLFIGMLASTRINNKIATHTFTIRIAAHCTASPVLLGAAQTLVEVFIVCIDI